MIKTKNEQAITSSSKLENENYIEEEECTYTEEEMNMNTSSESSYPISISNIKKGGHIIMNDRPCKVIDISIFKNGKHGHAKASIVGIDIFNKKKYYENCPASHTMYCPVISREEYILMGINDEYLSLVDKKGNNRSDLRLPEFCDEDELLCKKIVELFNDDKTLTITVLKSMNIEKIESFKENKEN